MNSIAVTIAPIVFAIGAGLITYAGGRCALGLADRTPLLLDFTAGAVIGAVLFDLLPEAVSLSGTTAFSSLLDAFAIGFLLYLALNRISGAGPFAQHVAPASLTFHSLLDGAGIGLAFHASPHSGLMVGVAVLAHDLADGINTVGLGLVRGSRRTAGYWLCANSAAPLAGALVGIQIPLEQSTTGLVLAGLCGGLFYLGASEILPRASAAGGQLRGALSTSVGMLSLFLIMLGLPQ